MARKPTRLWDPARRLLVQGEEQARALLAARRAATLEDVRPRLQHYLRAMYDQPVLIESLTAARKPRWTTRILHGLALVRERGASESTADIIRLPARLPSPRSDIPPLEQYRLIAVQHAERMRRDTARHARGVATDLERDLYQLAEAASVDAHIAETQPGLREALAAARTEAMAERPKPRWRSEIELRVEALFRRAWSRDGADVAPEGDFPEVPTGNDAEANATWARRTANALEARYGRKEARAYRRVPEITLWRTTVDTTLPEEERQAVESEIRETEDPLKPQGASSRSAMPGPSQSKSAQAGQGPPTPDSKSTETTVQRQPGGKDGRSPDGPSHPEPAAREMSARLPDVCPPGEAGEQDAGASPSDGAGTDTAAAAGHSDEVVDDAQLSGGVTYSYPEWDFNRQGFHPTGTVVRVVPPSLASSEWAVTNLRAHAREVHRARRQFERLRSHRLRLRRQVQGDELDLEACVEAMVDRRMQVAPSDRLYSLVRPGRRELAITLLIDVSGSTGEPVAGEQRVIDLERIAALVATAAFDALGDDYSILAFSSASASNVRVHTLKEFGERNSSRVLERISALTPHGTTRLGAAVRHATAQLAGHPAPHRLLLILSDGKPHDYDWYFVDYAIQDSRHAVLNARLQGIHPFCITVDATDGATYLGEIFGSAGYRVVSRPEHLSQALLQAVQRMIG